jgi:hypothetical protein
MPFQTSSKMPTPMMVSVVRPVSAQTWSNLTVSNDLETNPLNGIAADTYEIKATYDLTAATATDFGFELHRRGDGTRDAAIGYDRIRQTLAGASMPPINNRVKLRILVDRGQLETFGNDGRISVTDNQRWTFTAAGKIRIGNECLDQPGETIGNGAKLKTHPCLGGDNQRWLRVGTNQYQNSWSKRCMDLDAGNATNGRQLQVWDCVAGPNQKWSMPTN